MEQLAISILTAIWIGCIGLFGALIALDILAAAIEDKDSSGRALRMICALLMLSAAVIAKIAKVVATLAP